MSINLQALEQAFSAVEDVGKGEHTFTIHNTQMTLRVLLPEEEVEVQKFTSVVLTSGDEEEQHVAMAYLDRFKIAVISYALVQMGDLDLRGVDFIETGDTLPNGKVVKIPRASAIQEMIRGWSRHLLTGVFRKYAELLSKVEKQAEDDIEFEPVDLDAEIERLEERLEELRDAQKQDDVGFRDTFSDRVHKMADTDGAEDQERKQNLSHMDAGTTPEGFVPYEPPVESSPSPVESSPASIPQQERRSAIPQAATPPQKASVPTAPPVVQSSSEPESHDPLAGVQGSLVDPGSDDFATAVAEENARIAQRRARAGLAMSNVNHHNPDNSALTAMRQNGGPRRPPPHAAARQADQEVGLTEALPQSTPVKSLGSIDGAPVVQYGEPETLGVSSPKQAPGGKTPQLNPRHSGSLNPRFRGNSG